MSQDGGDGLNEAFEFGVVSEFGTWAMVVADALGQAVFGRRRDRFAKR